MIAKEKAIDILRRQIAAAREIRGDKRFSPEFDKWRRDTSIAIKKIFGEETGHTSDFESVGYSLEVVWSGTTDYEQTVAFQEGLDSACAILASMIQEIEDYGLADTVADEPNPVSILRTICSRFHAVAKQLRNRYNNRQTLDINDEYDVQDLLHAILRVFFEDIRPEEWTPSYAGASSRMDFLLKKEQVVVEVKKTRKNLGAKDVGEQLIVDIGKYQNHPDCKCLVCFVYDPDNEINNPVGIENDLSRSHGNLRVVVIIAPK